MERELYNWLEREFYKSNHTKYHRYFKEWITNICPIKSRALEIK